MAQRPRRDAGVVPLVVTGPIRWRESATVRAFKFLKENCKIVPKITLPAPLILHMFGGGDKGILEGHYKDIDAFWADVVKAYRTEVKALVDAGATYIQFDDTSIAFLCDPMHRESVRRWGSEPDALLRLYAARMNDVLADVPAHVTVTFHQCRGNREGSWMAEGGYDPVADVLFNAINIHGYFLDTTLRGPARSRRCACCRRAKSWCWASCPARRRNWNPPTI